MSHTWFRHVHTFLEMYKHVYTFLKMNKHVCTWYLHGIYIWRYKHVCTLFRRVCTCIYKYIHVLTHINMYIPCTNLNIHVCYIFLIYILVCQGMYSWFSVYRWLLTFHEMYRYHWTVYVHWCILLVSAFVFPGWLACRQGLAAARCHAYSSSSTQV